METADIIIRRIGADWAEDLRLPNEPFPPRGRLRVRYDGGAFTWEAETWPEERITEQTFPEEDYDYEAMKEDHFFAGAYLGERCVGLAIYERPWNRWLYLSDLKVCRDARRMGAARRLLEEGMAIAREEGYQGGLHHLPGQQPERGPLLPGRRLRHRRPGHPGLRRHQAGGDA